MSISQYCQLRNEVLLPEIKTNRRQWVIARSLCLYRLLDYRHIPAESRNQALAFEINNNGPFESTAHYVIWVAGLAQVWLWDNKNTQNLIEEQDVDVFEVIPESILRHDSGENGLKLLKVLGGEFELQFWNDKILFASRHFIEIPTEFEVEQFLLGVNRLSNFNFIDTSSMMVNKHHIIDSSLTTKHWSTANNTLASLKGYNLESMVVSFGFALLMGFIQWQFIAVYRSNAQLADIERQIEQNLTLAGPNVTAKANALIAAAKSSVLVDIIDFPFQSQLMIKFGQLIALQGGILKEWEYNIDHLDIVIEPSQASALTYVNLLQELDLVKTVSSEPGRLSGQIKLKIELNLQAINE